MKLSEAIAELEKDNSKEFESETIDLGSYTKLIVEHGMVRCNSFPARGLMLNRKWKEVKKSVDFITAVSALDRGKTIYVMHQGYKNTFSPIGNQTDWGVAIVQEQGYAIDTEYILYGKWYIED